MNAFEQLPRSQSPESSSRDALPRESKSRELMWRALAMVLMATAIGAVLFWPASVPRRMLVLIGAVAALTAIRAIAGPGGVSRLWSATLGRLPYWLRSTLVCAAVVVIAWRLARWPDVRGVAFLFYLGTAVVSVAVWSTLMLGALLQRDPKRLRLLAGATLITTGFVMLVVLGIEMVLGARAQDGADASSSGESSRWAELHASDPIDQLTFDRAMWRHSLALMPDSWRTQHADIARARRAYRWHDILHAEDDDGVRFANSTADVLSPTGAGERSPHSADSHLARAVLVIGDSFTYGMGIDTPDRFTERLELLLRGTASDVRVVNRGVCSDQSEDVLARLPGNLERVQPVLVVYAICLNDFLPSGVDVYDRSWRLPEWLVERARVLRTIDEGMVQGQIALGLSADFHSDILRNLGECRDRFARDVARMSELCRAHGATMVAIALDPLPSPDGSGARIAAAAEEACRAAGIKVVDTTTFRTRYAGVPLTVSRWEPHANEIAHAAWAALLFDTIRPMLDANDEPAASDRP